MRSGATIGILTVLLATALTAAQSGHHFHATAKALSTESGRAASDTRAAVELPHQGGDVSSSGGQYDDGDVRFDSAVSTVSGIEKDGVAWTSATVVIRNLDVRGVLRADEITLQIRGRHPKGEAEAEITFEGSQFRNVEVHGQPVELRTNFERYGNLPTFARLRSEVSERFGLFDEGPGARASGVIRESAVQLPGADDQRPNCLRIDGVGIACFGEVTARFGQRGLTMLRIELEDGIERVPGTRISRKRTPSRTIIIASGEGNGSNPYPP